MSPDPMIVTFFTGDPAICEVDKSLLLAQHKNSRFLPEKFLLLAILSILVKKEMLETSYTLNGCTTITWSYVAMVTRRNNSVMNIATIFRN